MIPHEWVEEEITSVLFGDFSFYSCKVCGAAVMDIYFTGVGQPKRLVIPGTKISLTNDCEESACIIQRYWEKEAKRKKSYTPNRKKKSIAQLHKKLYKITKMK